MFAKANTRATIQREELEKMARRRYQRGNLILRGKSIKKWVAKWREDVVRTDGTIHRVQRREVIGTLKEYKTKRLAERALEQRLAEVNSLTYKPRPTATFREFAASWQKDVLSQHKRSTQSADRSRLRKHLIPELGDLCMKDINRQIVQGIVARKAEEISAKSVRNLVALLREMWVRAKTDGYRFPSGTGLLSLILAGWNGAVFAAGVRVHAAEHDAADFHRTDAGVPVQGADQRLPRELRRRDVRAEGGGVDVDRVPARRLDDLHARGQEVLAQVGDAAQAIFEIMLVEHFGDAIDRSQRGRDAAIKLRQAHQRLIEQT